VVCRLQHVVLSVVWLTLVLGLCVRLREINDGQVSCLPTDSRRVTQPVLSVPLQDVVLSAIALVLSFTVLFISVLAGLGQGLRILRILQPKPTSSAAAVASSSHTRVAVAPLPAQPSPTLAVASLELTCLPVSPLDGAEPVPAATAATAGDRTLLPLRTIAAPAASSEPAFHD
jgi:hypothetical protein